MQARANGPGATVRAALLDYYSAPGKYQLALRQPPLLFASIKEILQIAADGRGASMSTVDAQVRDAAHFFIRAAMLYPGADHYALFGFAAKAAIPDLKERYRLLMRLIHPDSQESRSDLWPSDAAIQVNRAYKVLSSPLQRREYDEQLAAPPQPRPAPENRPRRSPAKPQSRRRAPQKWAWMLAAALALLGAILLLPHQDPVRIVQRSSQKATVPAVSGIRAGTEPAPDAGIQAPRTVDAQAPAELAVPALPEVLPAAERVEARNMQRPEVVRPVLSDAGPWPRPAALPAPRASGGAAGAPSPVLRVDEPARAMPRVQAAAPPVAPAPAPGTVEPPIAAAAAAPPVPAPTPPRPAQLQTAALAAPPSMAEVQALLSDLLQRMESGNASHFLRLVEAEGRVAPGALALRREYDGIVHGARPVRLSHAEFRGEPREGALLVTGRLRLHAGETPVGFHGERLGLRAEFVSRGGRILLIGLTSAPD